LFTLAYERRNKGIRKKIRNRGKEDKENMKRIEIVTKGRKNMVQ
jgi:hypothetical protein